jgi:hypothetical protein
MRMASPRADTRLNHSPAHEEFVVFAGVADPEPDKIIAICNRDRAVMKPAGRTNTGQPSSDESTDAADQPSAGCSSRRRVYGCPREVRNRTSRTCGSRGASQVSRAAFPQVSTTNFAKRGRLCSPRKTQAHFIAACKTFWTSPPGCATLPRQIYERSGRFEVREVARVGAGEW